MDTAGHGAVNRVPWRCFPHVAFPPLSPRRPSSRVCWLQSSIPLSTSWCGGVALPCAAADCPWATTGLRYFQVQSTGRCVDVGRQTSQLVDSCGTCLVMRQSVAHWVRLQWQCACQSAAVPKIGYVWDEKHGELRAVNADAEPIVRPAFLLVSDGCVCG